MTLEVIMAGFGGQGVMLIGMLLSYGGMLEKKYVSWMPSYGPEMRGGTANCSVVVSPDPIVSPVVTEPTVVVAMNLPSMDKFEPVIRPGGLLIVNSSLINRKAKRDDIKVVEVPANDIADNLGNLKVANMVILGALLGLTEVVSIDSIVTSLKKVLPERRHDLIPVNKAALEKGYEWVKK